MKMSFTPLLKTTAIILALGLGACSKDMYYTGAETPKRNEVQMVRLVHDVRLSHHDQLSDTELKRLDAFLHSVNVQYGDRLSLDLGENGNDNTRASLANALKARGLKLEAQEVISGALPLSGTGRLVLDRYVVKSPQCKSFDEQVIPDRNYAEGVSFGCASTSLLGLMVADKRDLIEGKDDASANPDQAGNAVRLGRNTTGLGTGAATTMTGGN